MRRLSVHPALALAFLVASPLALAVSADPTLAQAEDLLARQQPKSAFDLLAPLEDERGGSPDYDYLYGVAALESGQAGIAAFAFERCLAVDPANGPCRVQMARTHMALGENDSAELELKSIQANNPPPEVDALVNRYLGNLTQRELDAKRHLGAWAQVGIGMDSNANSATSDEVVAIPLFNNLPFQLLGLSVERDDNFVQAAAGVNYSYKLSPSLSLLLDGSASGRSYLDIDQLSSIDLNTGVGLGWRQGPDSLSVKLQGQKYYLDDDKFRDLVGALGQYQHALNDKAALTAYAQASQLDYRAGSVNSMRYTVGAGYSQALSGSWNPVAYGGLYGGTEKPDSGLGAGQTFTGLRLGGSLALRSNLSVSAALSAEHRQFDGVDILFQVEREDDQIDLNLGLIYQPEPHFTVRPSITISDSSSNIALNEFDRQVFSLDMRYEL